MDERIRNMLLLLEEEQRRVKVFINENGFDCTTAAFVIAKNYRDELKKHIKVLNDNLNQEKE